MNMVKSTLKIKNLEDSTKKLIFQNINSNGYVVVRGLFDVKEIKIALKNLKKNFRPSLDNPSSSGKPKEIKKNFQKLCIGSASINGEKIYRLHRVIYNPFSSRDMYNLKKIFIKFANVRNILLGFKKNFCIEKNENNLWSANRILQYPIGGGHMSCHSDYILKNISKKNNINNFYQLILLLTKKKIDYKYGGAYIINKNKKIFIEDNTQQGDLLIYKSTIKHGVDEIDPNKKLNLKNINGRIVLMNSLYQDFTKKKSRSKFFKYL